MKISAGNKKKLLKEIKFVIEQMENEEDPKSKLYYFSAVYGVMSRIFNEEFNPDLVFAHLVISAAYGSITTRLNTADSTIKVPDEIYESLIEITKELHGAIEKDKSLYEALKKISMLTFVTSGNGYYLYKKGYFKI